MFCKLNITKKLSKPKYMHMAVIKSGAYKSSL